MVHLSGPDSESSADVVVVLRAWLKENERVWLIEERVGERMMV